MAGKKISVETVLTGRDAGVKKMWEDAAKAAEFYSKTINHVGSAFNAFQSLTTGGLILGAGAGLVGVVLLLVAILRISNQRSDD
jgi:hypothetical protein